MVVPVDFAGDDAAFEGVLRDLGSVGAGAVVELQLAGGDGLALRRGWWWQGSGLVASARSL